jgi:hypothetical protein
MKYSDAKIDSSLNFCVFDARIVQGLEQFVLFPALSQVVRTFNVCSLTQAYDSNSEVQLGKSYCSFFEENLLFSKGLWVWFGTKE